MVVCRNVLSGIKKKKLTLQPNTSSMFFVLDRTQNKVFFLEKWLVNVRMVIWDMNPLGRGYHWISLRWKSPSINLSHPRLLLTHPLGANIAGLEFGVLQIRSTWFRDELGLYFIEWKVSNVWLWITNFTFYHFHSIAIKLSKIFSHTYTSGQSLHSLTLLHSSSLHIFLVNSLIHILITLLYIHYMQPSLLAQWL